VVNIVLFEKQEAENGYLPLSDERAAHLSRVLGFGRGDRFDAGLVNGPRGKAKIEAIAADRLSFSFEPTHEAAPLAKIDLLVGLCRPQTMRKVLFEASSMGVRRIELVKTGRGEPSYADSKLWTSGEWRRHLVAGASQAFSTRLPRVAWGGELAEVLSNWPEAAERFCLDNYEAQGRLGALLRRSGAAAGPLALGIGSERGWTKEERALFRAHAWSLAGLGERVLRTETAVVASLALCAEAFDS